MTIIDGISLQTADTVWVMAHTARCIIFFDMLIVNFRLKFIRIFTDYNIPVMALVT